MPFTQNTVPTFPKQPKVFSAAIGNNDAQAWKLLLDNAGAGAGANGAKISSVIAASTDTAARNVQLALVRSYAGATITIATPGVVSWAAANGNNLTVGDQVMFLANGDALPTGLSPWTTYYVIAAGFTFGASFELAATAGGAAINTSGTQSGVHLIAVVRPFLTAVVPITAGTDGVTANANLLGNPLNVASPAAVGLAFDSDGDPYTILESGDYLAVSAKTTVAANYLVTVLASAAANF